MKNKSKTKLIHVEKKLPKSGLFLLILLVMAVFMSAIGVVYSTHVSRVLVNELQELQDARDEYQIKWGQLLLEQSTWAAPNRIERVVSKDLKMNVPEKKDIRMVIIEK